MTLQAAPLIGMTKLLNSVTGSSDRHAQLLAAGNFEITLKLELNFSA